MKVYENKIVNYKAEEQSKKRKAEERNLKGGGKNFTHNIKG